VRSIIISNATAFGLGRILLRNCAFRDFGLVLPRLCDLQEDLFDRRGSEAKRVPIEGYK
jgi:hypothetical protein